MVYAGKMAAKPIAIASMIASCMAAWQGTAQAQAANPLQTAGSFATVLTTLNAGFFSQGSAVTSVPGNPAADQMGRGVWVRGNAGLFDIKSNGTLNGSATVARINARSTFAGVQAGVDLGNFNIGSTGLNLVYGVTGGEVSVAGSAGGTAGIADYTIPFAGAYFVISKDGFVAEASYRHDFDSSTLNDPATGLVNSRVSGATNTEAVSLSYRRNLPSSFFIEPSVAFAVSRFSTDSFFVPIGFPTPGTFQANPINSDLGRAGFRLGRDFNIGGVVVEPFVAASVWREFADPNSAVFTPVVGPVVLSGSTTRVGTFGQYSVGFSAVAPGGLLLFARGDLRSGSALSGNTITGGFRYSF